MPLWEVADQKCIKLPPPVWCVVILGDFLPLQGRGGHIHCLGFSVVVWLSFYISETRHSLEFSQVSLGRVLAPTFSLCQWPVHTSILKYLSPALKMPV